MSLSTSYETRYFDARKNINKTPFPLTHDRPSKKRHEQKLPKTTRKTMTTHVLFLKYAGGQRGGEERTTKGEDMI